jgi:glycerophosphoryl diester phosphodiesterase
MQIFAHRGNSSEAPENTLPAFRGAQQAGVAGVELDVQLSKDGVPVVIHDERLERTTSGTGWVGEHSLAELKQMDVGRWFGPAYEAERLPTLAELLELFRGGPMIVNIELKTNRVAYPGLVPAALREIERTGMTEQVLLSSFNHHSLKEARALAPRVACAAILYDRLIEPWEYGRQHGFQALHAHFSQVDQALIEGCRVAGLPVRAWTVDDVAVAQRLVGLGVRGLITNRPREMLAALR